MKEKTMAEIRIPAQKKKNHKPTGIRKATASDKKKQR